MKYLIIILTICSILGKDIYQASWDVWYMVNKEYVAKVLCENQDVPMLNCNGKCYLTKQLEKAETALKDLENKHKNNRPIIKEGMKIAQSHSIQPYFEETKAEITSSEYQPINTSLNSLFTNSIDHPPQS